MVRLGNFVKITNGFAFKSSQYKDLGGRVIRITNVQKGIIEDSNPKFYPENLLSKLEAYKIFEGDILMSLTGNVGRVGKFPKELLPAYINQRVCRVKSNSPQLLDDYLFHILNSDDFESRAINSSTGIAQMNLSTKWIEEFEIPLPPLETQKRIAQILDDAQALKQKTEQILKEYDALAQSIFLDMFGDPVTNPKGWGTKVLGEICGVGSSKRVFVDELTEKGIPFYRGTEIGRLSEGVIIKPKFFITKEHYFELKKHTGVPKVGDLLMPSICPDGRIYQVENEYPFYFKDGRVLWIKIDSLEVNSYYLKTFLKELFYTNYSNIASGTTFAELKINALKKIKLLSPPIKLQNQFAEKIALIEQQKDLAKQELKESEDLFNCLLQKAFKGELV